MENIKLAGVVRSEIKSGNTNSVIRIIDSNPSILQMITPFGSWLHVAVSFGNLELVKHLVTLGCDINQRSGTFNSAPINHAASNGYIDIVVFLLEKGASLDVSKPERNPLFAAIYGGHIEIVELLIKSGIDYLVRYSGESMKNVDAYAFAVERGQLEIATLLSSIKSKVLPS